MYAILIYLQRKRDNDGDEWTLDFYGLSAHVVFNPRWKGVFGCGCFIRVLYIASLN